MPEASGYIALKVPENVGREIVQNEGEISDSAIKLLEAASNTHFPEKLGYYQEAPKLLGSYVLLAPFGMEWMAMAEQIVRQGSSVELYGRMSDEYGGTTYYALNADEDRYIYALDEEGDEEDEMDFDEVEEQVKELTPKELLKGFPRLYSLG